MALILLESPAFLPPQTTLNPLLPEIFALNLRGAVKLPVLAARCTVNPFGTSRMVKCLVSRHFNWSQSEGEGIQRLRQMLPQERREGAIGKFYGGYSDAECSSDNTTT